MQLSQIIKSDSELSGLHTTYEKGKVWLQNTSADFRKMWMDYIYDTYWQPWSVRAKKKKVDDIFNQPIYFFTICNAESDSLWVVLQGRNLMFTGLNLQLLTELQYELLLQRAVGHRQHLLQQLDQPHVLHKTRELA